MSAQTRRYGGLAVTTRKAHRRRLFLDAATRICAERGSLTCSLIEICAAANLSKRQFYEEFATLDEVIVAACARIQDDAAEAVARTLAALPTPTDPVTVLHAALTAYLVSIDSEPYRAAFALLAMNGDRAARQCQTHTWAGHLQNALATTGVRLEGETARLLAVAVNALAREWMSRDPELPLSGLIELLTDLAMLLATRAGSEDSPHS